MKSRPEVRRLSNHSDFSSFATRDIREHPVDLSTTGQPTACRPTYMRVSACLTACLLGSPILAGNHDENAYPRLGLDSLARQALPTRHSSARLTARPDCAVQVYSADVSTSGRGKGVPRRSYTHATRHRRSMANKEKEKGKKEEPQKVALRMPKLRPAG